MYVPVPTRGCFLRLLYDTVSLLLTAVCLPCRRCQDKACLQMLRVWGDVAAVGRSLPLLRRLELVSDHCYADVHHCTNAQPLRSADLGYSAAHSAGPLLVPCPLNSMQQPQACAPGRLSAIAIREGGGGGGGGAAAARSVGAGLGGGADSSSKWASSFDAPAAGPATGRSIALRRQWVEGSESEC